MSTAFIPDKIFTGYQMLSDQAVLVQDGLVTDILPANQIPARSRPLPLPGLLLAPAFIDLQLYGGNGKLFSTELSVEALEATYESCLSGGSTSFMITMATNAIDKYQRAIEVVRTYWSLGGKGLLGLHLEGPYISNKKKGAHLERFIKKPSLAEMQMLLKRGKDVLRMITVAPEVCDAPFIRLLKDSNLLVSAGHSDASYTEASRGFELGIPLATHLFNAMSPLQGRAPGMVGAIYDHAAVCASIVCDGIHVDFASVRISKKIMGERLFFITDAVVEISHGEYLHQLRQDRYCLPDGTLSGSALTMLKAVQNGVANVGIPLTEALRMASLYPARILGMEKMIGSIQSGSKADFVLLDQDLQLHQLIIEGE